MSLKKRKVSYFFKSIVWFLEYLLWRLRCDYALRMHGYHGLSSVLKQIPDRYIQGFLRKYGASIGNDVHIESGIYIHRPIWKNKPFENLSIGNNVYLGHEVIIDLSMPVTIKDACNIGSRVQIWTHASYYKGETFEERELSEFRGEVVIEACATVYSNSIIKQGVHIGTFASVTANSMVNTNVEAYATASGVPVRVLRKSRPLTD